MADVDDNKLFKVLYGPLNHVYYISIHTKPNKSFLLFDESYHQIRRIDLNNVKCFQRRTIQSDDNKPTKYIIEIFWHNDSTNALTFTFLTYEECDILCKNIELSFGVQVYNYGRLNVAFRKDLMKNDNSQSKLKGTPDTAGYGRKYELYKEVYNNEDLYDFNGFNDNLSIKEPNAEFSTKFPVIIEGTMEEGTYLSYRSIKTANSPPFTVYKAEWYLSKSKWNDDQYNASCTSSDDTFYMKEYMIGHYVMIKVYKAIKTHSNRHYIYSTTTKGPIIPSNILAHNMLLNSTKDIVVHNAQIAEEDLKLLFNSETTKSSEAPVETTPDTLNCNADITEADVTTESPPLSNNDADNSDASPKEPSNQLEIPGTQLKPKKGKESKVTSKLEAQDRVKKEDEKVHNTDSYVSVEVSVTFKGLTIMGSSLLWSRIQPSKTDDLPDGREPAVADQLDNRLLLKIKSDGVDDFISIVLHLQSTFQRNVLYHSIIFNKHRRHYYSMDRCERDLQQGYYNGVKSAYVKICKTAFKIKP